MSRAIRAEPDWIKTLNNADTRTAWAAKARAQPLTDAEFAYVLDELAYYSSLHLPDSSARLSTAGDVWYSDTLIDDETTNELKKRVAILEDVPDRQKDWYPEGQSRVLNLIDPSLYPLVYIKGFTDIVHPCQPRVKPDASKCYTSNTPMPVRHSNDYHRWKAQAEFVPPQPEPFVAPARPATSYGLRGRGLQAIVRMSNVEPTPENLIYSGEEWKLTGLANEGIIATGVLFYGVANVALSSLRFREAISGWDFEADNLDVDSMIKAYGLDEITAHDEYYLSQEVGNVDIKNGQCLVFPGVYRHKMPELKLGDSTKPGHCKMLMLCLADPSTRILLTEIVPPQQQDWRKEDVLRSKLLRNLPRLIMDRITKWVDYPISMKDAKKLRRDWADQYGRVLGEISYHNFETCFDYAYMLH
ncbi:hypothetical protein IW152_002028 [Coemansia sp. BCRC 34962]|nr:hypothetical protein IW152_002028 [Coemansia sp. BCRC 34962]